MDRRYYRKLDKYKDQIIVAYRDNNMTMQEIASVYNATPATVYLLLKKYKVKTRRRGKRFYEIRVVAEKYQKENNDNKQTLQPDSISS